MVHYIDTSALAKLIVLESETPALLDWLKENKTDLATSELTHTELMRTVRRFAPDRATASRKILGQVIALSATKSIFESAANIEPKSLKSLDAVHVTTALSLGDELEGVITYDQQMAGAVEGYGFPVIAPS